MTTVGQPLPPFTGHAPDAHHEPSGVLEYRTYWVSWGALLALTVLMLFTETLALGRGSVLVLLLGAMLVKAGVITAWFMHLRFERAALVVAVVGATVLTAMALFALIAPDGAAMLRHAAR
jgi:caa(3)-type oxidase subunit IV